MRAIKITSYFIISIVLMMGTKQANAQLAGLQSIYFDNQYLANPAMAGLDKGLNLNAGYQAQWTSVPGGPRLQDLTADYNSGNRVGLGFIVNNDATGLISRTRILGTYAYHLPVSETGKLNFGLSFGVNDSYIDYSKINGDQGDVSVGLFNQRRIYLDGDVGIAYTTESGLNIQAAVPNLGSILFNSDGSNLAVDRSTFYTAISYKYQLGDYTRITVEPKLAYRGVKGFQDIADIGGNLTLDDYGLNMMGLYHTNKAFTAGIGFNLPLSPIRVLFSYTGNAGALGYYANNTFEFGLKYMLFKTNKNP